MKAVSSLALIVVLGFSLTGFAGETKTVKINIEGMTCNGCVQKVESILKKVEGVSETNVVLASHSATVTYDVSKTNEKSLKEAVNLTGFKAGSVEEAKKADTDAKVSKRAGCGGGCCSSARKTNSI